MLKGSIVALITPMHACGNVDYEALIRLLHWHLRCGTHALVILGTTGEAASLSASEKIQIIETCVEVVQNRIPIIVGTGSASTEETIKNTQLAERCGARACLVVTPYYVKPTQQGLLAHYKKLAQETELPIILYNVPSRTGCDLLPETLLALADYPTLVAVKDASADLSRLQHGIELLGDRFVWLSGHDPNTIEFIRLGGQGVISVAANVIPTHMAKLCEAALAGNWEQAQSLGQPLAPLFEALSFETNPIPIKWALHLVGQIDTGIRLPLTPLSYTFHARLLQSLHACQAMEASKLDLVGEL